MKLVRTLALTSIALAAATASFAQNIKIGVAGPFTGGSSSMGVSMRDGVRLAVDEINKAGGVMGRKLEVRA
jgi:branched-chain amino acid transport system substrate-binding protein